MQPNRPNARVVVLAEYRRHRREHRTPKAPAPPLTAGQRLVLGATVNDAIRCSLEGQASWGPRVPITPDDVAECVALGLVVGNARSGFYETTRRGRLAIRQADAPRPHVA